MTQPNPVYKVVVITYVDGVAHINETRNLTRSYATDYYGRMSNLYADRDDVEVLLEQQASSFGELELDTMTFDDVEL